MADDDYWKVWRVPCRPSNDSGPENDVEDFKRFPYEKREKLKRTYCSLKESYATLNVFRSQYSKEVHPNNNNDTSHLYSAALQTGGPWATFSLQRCFVWLRHP